MKKVITVVAIMLTFIMMLSCISVCAYTIDRDFEDNLIALSKRALWYEVTVEKFAHYGVIEVEQTGVMSYILTLDKHDHQNVLDVISQINKSEDSYVIFADTIPYPTPTQPPKDYVYKDKFIEYEMGDYYTLYHYDELYYHIDADGNVDWALLYAETGPFAEVGSVMYLGERILVTDNLYSPFTYKYGIYDVKEDKFVGIDEYIDYEKYDGLKDYVYANVGVLFGDADSDDELSIIDATMIQRCVAQICTYKEKYWMDDYCDMDCDRDITVMDATIIQRKIANLD